MEHRVPVQDETWYCWQSLDVQYTCKWSEKLGQMFFFNYFFIPYWVDQITLKSKLDNYVHVWKTNEYRYPYRYCGKLNFKREYGIIGKCEKKTHKKRFFWACLRRHLPVSTPQIAAVRSAEAVPISGLFKLDTHTSQIPSRWPCKTHL
jgi:hypothetical protein